jgi:dethiobiotin synthetase
MSLNDPLNPQEEAELALEEALLTEAQPQPLGDGVPSRFSCFVTGTDTEIGKTLVSAAILHKLVQGGLRACGMKPVAAGAELRDGVLHNDDADSLIAAGNVRLPANITTPFMLRAAAAPHIAAELEGVRIASVPIIAAYAEIAAASDAVVVEGVGGFRVPFAPGFDSADLAEQLNLPIILVVGLRLGCINHALLTIEAILARGLVLAGWVANLVDPKMGFVEENVEALLLRIPAPLLGRVPHLEQPTAAKAAEFIDLAGLPGWPSARD